MPRSSRWLWRGVIGDTMTAVSKPDMKRYPVPARESRVEMRVKGSRFMATLAPAFSVEEARTFVERVRQEFADATHNVPAYVVGYGPRVVAHCNDDGEPSGTAGRPVLAVLQGSGLGDAALVQRLSTVTSGRFCR